MGSRFLSGGDGTDLAVLQEGTFALNVASTTVQDLTPGSVVRANADKEIISTQIEQTDLGFQVLTNPLTEELVADGVQVTSGNTLKTDTIEATSGQDLMCVLNATKRFKVDTVELDDVYSKGLNVSFKNPISLGNNSISNVSTIGINEIVSAGDPDVSVQVSLNLNSNDITNAGTITSTSIAATNTAGTLMTGNIDMGENSIQRCVQADISLIVPFGSTTLNIDGDVVLLGSNGLTASSVTTAALGNAGGTVAILDNIDLQTNALFNLRTITGNGVDSVQILNAGQGLEALCDRVRLQSVNNLELSAGASDISAESNIAMNDNSITNVNNLEVSSINSITPVGGLYSGISDGATISSSTPADLLPVTSVGSLNVPADPGFQVGDAYHLVCAGTFPSESKNDEVEVQLSAVNGSTVILGTVLLSLENFDTVSSNFEIEADFVVRSIGASGQISTSFDFTFNKGVTKDFKGTRSTSLATINTTIAQTLELNARILGSGGSSIKSTLAYLRKQY